MEFERLVLASVFFYSCDNKRKGNRMMGVGDQCGAYGPSGNGTVRGRGQITVYPMESLEFSKELTSYPELIASTRERHQRGCRYEEWLTSGVLCCDPSREC